MFQAMFQGKDMPNKYTMSRIIAKFRQRSTVCNLWHVREKTALTPACWQQCRLNRCQTTQELPNFCQVVRKHRNKGLLYGTAHHATEALGLHSYRVCVIHELLPLDYNRCMAYCQWLLTFAQTCPGMLNNVFYFDEEWLQLPGYVNSPTPANLETLKANIMRAINKILQTMLTNVAGNVARRPRACISAVGG